MENKISRVNRSKSEASDSYNNLSRWYDLLAGSSERKFREAGLEMLAARPGERILEIGYGTGHCILALAQAVGESGKVYGVDISTGMHAIARERVTNAGLAERVEITTGDAARHQVQAESLDAVFMSFTLELFDTPEIPLVLGNCYAALRPGGRICVVSLAKSEKDNLMVRMYEWFHEVMPRYADCRPIFVRSSVENADFQVQSSKVMSMWGLPVEIVLGVKSPE
jgi:demethylmenaquinone methyltransferase/2-methoxy-6-polyprenyl-1,4-benzoquinol methylase